MYPARSLPFSTPPAVPAPWHNQLWALGGRIFLLALFYILSGKLGLLFASPPGYASLIWPPSGIAMGALVVFGRRLWPGVLIGSFLLNSEVAESFSLAANFDPGKIMIPLGIAIGSTLQTVFGTFVLRHLLGIPVKLRSWRDVIVLLLVGGPLSCLIAASIGTATVWLFHGVTTPQLAQHWLTWWMGDVAGVLIFLPVAVTAPLLMEKMVWRGTKLGLVPASIFALFAAGAIYFSGLLYSQENGEIRRLIEHEADTVDRVLVLRMENNVHAMQRMADRWRFSEGTPQEAWLDDAKNMLGETRGLAAMSWIDTNYDVRWLVEATGPLADTHPFTHDEEAIKTALGDIGAFRPVTLTPAASFPSGKTGFAILVPLRVRDVASGYLGAGFSAQEFFSSALANEALGDYTLSLENNGGALFQNGSGSSSTLEAWRAHRILSVYNQIWKMELTPTPRFIAAQRSALPLVVMVSGLLIALLLGVLSVYIIVSGAKSGVLASSEERNDLAIKGMSAGLWDWNIATGAVYWSPRYCQIIGAGPDIIPSRAYSESRIPKEDRARIDAALHAHLYEKKPFDIEYRYYHGQDRFITLHATGQAVWDESGAPRRMVGAISDISAQRRAEEDLRLSEDTFRSAMHYAPVGMGLADAEGRWLTANRALCELVGYSEKELLATDFQSLTHPDDLQTDLDCAAKLLSGKIQSYQLDQRYIHKQGHIIDAALNASLVRGADGTPKYFILQIRDVGPLKQAQDEREKLIARLTESNTELERFAYIASHDLQEPLRMIGSFSTLLVIKYTGILDAQGKEYLGMIGAGATRMTAMVKDLLDYARVDGHAALDIVKMEAKLAAAMENLGVAIDVSGAVITHENLPELKGNRLQLIRLLQNLIGNALRYQEKGAIPRIHVAAEEADHEWRFSVADNGIGIDPSYTAQIFEPFKRLHTWREYEGTGIGLAVCKKIVERHKGRIWVDSKPGQGATFYFTLAKAV